MEEEDRVSDDSFEIVTDESTSAQQAEQARLLESLEKELRTLDEEKLKNEELWKQEIEAKEEEIKQQNIAFKNFVDETIANSEISLERQQVNEALWLEEIIEKEEEIKKLKVTIEKFEEEKCAKKPSPPVADESNTEERWKEKLQEKEEENDQLRLANKKLEEEKIAALDELEITRIGSAEREDIILRKIMRIYELEDRLEVEPNRARVSRFDRYFGSYTPEELELISYFERTILKTKAHQQRTMIQDSHFFSTLHIQTVGFISIFADLLASSALGSLYWTQFPTLAPSLLAAYVITVVVCFADKDKMMRRVALYIYTCFLICRILIAFGLLFYSILGAFWFPFTVLQAYIAVTYARYEDMIDPEILPKIDRMLGNGWESASLLMRLISRM